jgi:carboxyl-terminal processing protease
MSQKHKKNSFITSLLIAIIFFGIGFFTQGELIAANNNTEENRDMSLFWDVWSLMEEKYPFDHPSEERLYYGAIEGLIEAYDDPYSVFFPPTESTSFEENIAGEFAGAGMEVAIRDGYLTVVTPLEGSPAQEAGFLPGDVIVKIDGESVDGLSLDQAVGRIRGKAGTEVTLTVMRNGEIDPLDLTLTRDTVIIPTLDTEIIDDTFVIKLYNFNENAEAAFARAIREFRASKKPYLILDLRNNPGGYLDASIFVASYFLDDGLIIVEEDFGDESETNNKYRSRGFDTLRGHDFQMAVLINHGSASASEIVAGALQDHGVAEIYGETSFGKGSVQEYLRLPQKTSLKVTIARWLTPKGKRISEIGIKPDHFIEWDLDMAPDDIEGDELVDFFDQYELNEAIRLLKE